MSDHNPQAAAQGAIVAAAFPELPEGDAMTPEQEAVMASARRIAMQPVLQA